MTPLPPWTVEATDDLALVVVRRTSDERSPMGRRRYECRARNETRAELTLVFDSGGLLAGVRARHLDALVAPQLNGLEAYRRDDLGIPDPIRVRIGARTARIIYAPFYWTQTWDALFVAFAEDAWDEWKDVYVGDLCRTHRRSGFFGLCLDIDGRVNGLIVQGPHPLLEPAAASALDRPRRQNRCLWPGPSQRRRP